MARPQKDVDAAQVENLAAILCTVAEIAAVLGVSIDTINRRFAASLEKGRQHGKASLRRSQFKSAIAGNATMQIWLGKQVLGQSDKLQVTDTSLAEKSVEDMTPEELNGELARLEAAQGRTAPRVGKKMDPVSRLPN